MATDPLCKGSCTDRLASSRFIQEPGACRLNAAEMLIDVTKDASGTQTQWVAEAGMLDVFFLLGPNPVSVRPSSVESYYLANSSPAVTP